MNDILIVSRDTNGEVTKEFFENSDDAIEYCQVMADEMDDEVYEILLVCVCGVCAYSALATQFVINWEDVIGFLA